jgi:hypothetical protein
MNPKYTSKTYSSVQEMMDEMEKELQARSTIKKIWDFIYWRIIKNMILDALNPRYNCNRIKRLFFRIKHGWDSKELWDLDRKIVEKFQKNLVDMCLHEYASPGRKEVIDKILWSMNFLIDDKIDIAAGRDKIIADNQKMLEGFELFGKEFLTFDPDFIIRFSDYVHPRLVELKKVKQGVPPGVPGVEVDTEESFKGACDLWDIYMDKMIYAFGKIIEHSVVWRMHSNPNLISMGIEKDMEMYKQDTKIQEGLDLFGVYFTGLWD